uniref:ubiquitinyl hydrolase 1 n=1 Tax=Oncorhynchus mykiss TaxID=8022 RepID=A0A8C7R4B0_ONCMY
QMDAQQFVSSREEIPTGGGSCKVLGNAYSYSYQYKYIQEIRGEGNCFYRALCFGHLESLLQKDRPLPCAFVECFGFQECAFAELLDEGIDENSFKYLLNMYVGVLEQCEADEHGDTLLQLFNEQTTFDSMVQYLRLLTLAYLQNHSDFFSHFVEAPSLKVYCTQEVETMAMECDHIDILALSEALDGQCLAHHTIPEGTQPSLHLLYKTAHYDILYPHHCH